MVHASEATPETRYAASGDVSIAYQTVGQGAFDLVLAPGFPSHLEHAWDQPRLAYFYRRLASFTRLILFDKRGLGLSDRVADSEPPGIEQRMDDIVRSSMRRTRRGRRFSASPTEARSRRCSLP